MTVLGVTIAVNRQEGALTYTTTYVGAPFSSAKAGHAIYIIISGFRTVVSLEVT